MPEAGQTRAYLALFAIMILWGSYPAMAKPVTAVTSPFFPAPRLTSALAWSVVLYQAIAGAVAHVWWYRAVEVIGPSRSAIFMNLQPVVGIALAALLLAEPLTRWQLIGGAFVLGGVALTTRR